MSERNNKLCDRNGQNPKGVMQAKKTIKRNFSINKNFSKNLLSYRGFILWGKIDVEFKRMQWVSFKKIIKKFY